MARFIYEEIKLGYEGRICKTLLAVKDIIFEDDDREVFIPSEHNGIPVTHIAYRQGYVEEHVRFHDWHHPAQGDGYFVPKEYVVNTASAIMIPDHVEKLVFPASVTDIYGFAFRFADPCKLVLDPAIKGYEVKDNKIVEI